tara:strand:+ start:73 stop:693 length:621 start_codon:yes stop_codon:yes gene_type:complete
MPIKKVHIIDYGIGNLGSISNILIKIGVSPICLQDPNTNEEIETIILPGVGSFDHCIKKLKDNGFVEFLENFKKTGKPIIGICVGAQMMCSFSEEGTEKGLNWFSANVIKFEFNDDSKLRIPHMGWNQIEIVRNHKIVESMDSLNRFYFLHSYYINLHDQKEAVANSHYGHSFNSIIQKENLIGIQFHPEKSHKYGIKLFENIISL